MSSLDLDALRQLGLLFAALAVAGGSVLTASRLAPIVLGKKFHQPRTFREWFFKDDGDVSESGFVMMMLSAAVLLAALLAVSVAARLMGVPFA